MAADPMLALRKQAITAIQSRLTHISEQAGDEPMTQTQLAQILRLTRPRLNLLMNGRAAEFSLEALLRIALRVGLSVRLKLARPYGSG